MIFMISQRFSRQILAGCFKQHILRIMHTQNPFFILNNFYLLPYLRQKNSLSSCEQLDREVWNKSCKSIIESGLLL